MLLPDIGVVTIEDVPSLDILDWSEYDGVAFKS